MGTLGIILAIAVIVFMSMKGFSIIFIAPVASIIVILTNGMDFFPSLIGTEASFMTGLTVFIVNFFAIFLLGAILAQYIEKVVLLNRLRKKYFRLLGQKSRLRF